MQNSEKAFLEAIIKHTGAKEDDITEVYKDKDGITTSIYIACSVDESNSKIVNIYVIRCWNNFEDDQIFYACDMIREVKREDVYKTIGEITREIVSIVKEIV